MDRLSVRHVFSAQALAAILLIAVSCGGDDGDTSDLAPTDVTAEPQGPEDTGGLTDTDSEASASDGDLDESSDARDQANETGDSAPVEPTWVTPDEALSLVDPFIGTGGLGFGYAALTPAVQAPFGLVRLGPDTSNGPYYPDFNHFSGYHADDPDVRGFSHTHFVGTGVVDYGNLRVLPLRDLGDGDPGSHFTRIDKATEAAEPGFYSVDLPDQAVGVELTASPHAGVHRYTFRGPDEALLVFDAAASVTSDGVLASQVEVSAETIRGWVEYDGGYVGRTRPFTLFFDGTIDPPARSVRVWDDSGLFAETEAAEARGIDTGAVLSFEIESQAAAPTLVSLRLGLSVVDAEQARLNRETEVGRLDFEAVREATRQLWRSKLSAVRLGDPDETVARIFYTALYNAYRMPTRFDGVDGRYRGLDGEVHQAEGFVYLTDLSLWDTFRTLHPWLTLTDPAAQRDCLMSLMAMRSDGGYFPRWPAALSYTGGMIGSSADIVFADSALKGVEGVDYAAAFEGLLETANGPTPDGHPFSGRVGIEDYLDLGYLPFEDYSHSVSRTLEYAYADWALANLAEHLGREEAAVLRSRGQSYRNLFHAESGFFRPRNRAGTFDASGSTTNVFMNSGAYTEGSAWHWRFYAPHDPAGLAELLGGPQTMAAALEAFFASSALGSPGPVVTMLPDPYYWHGNEPTIHVPLMFSEVDRDDRLAHWVREVQTRLYGTGPDGLPGNDDGGTLSAWYLFNAIGLYPIAGSDLYTLSTPLVPHAEVCIDGDALLTIEAPDASVENRFVRSVSLDGEPIVGGRVRHGDLVDATLFFEMAGSP